MKTKGTQEQVLQECTFYFSQGKTNEISNYCLLLLNTMHCLSVLVFLFFL